MSEHQSVRVSPNFKLVAKIGMITAVACCFALVGVLFAVVDERGVHYWQIIGSFDVARQSLGPAMLVFGLAMVGFAGVTTWLLALYASFRVAGPLYRISRNLEQQIAQGTVAPVPIRATDALQREWQEFEAGVAELRRQHDGLRQALRGVETLLDASPAGAGGAQLGAAIARLREAEQHVRL